MKLQQIAACALFAGLGVYANSAGPLPGLAGAPGEADCTMCHGSSTAGPGRVTIALSAGGATYAPGQALKVKVTIEDPTAIVWGFQLTARLASASASAGGKLTSADNRTRVEAEGGVEFISQTGAGTQRNTRTSASWEFNWMAPAAGMGGVTFYAAGNAANGNGSSDPADKIYKASLALTEAGGGAATVPLVAFGSGWSSTLYFVNATDAEVSFDAKFRKNDGAAMDVAHNGETASTHKVTIAARGLGTISAADSGSLSQGSAAFDLPDGVTGFNLLKLSAQGAPDQELQIPIVKVADLAKGVVVVFDDAKADTQLAVANPAAAEASVTLTARDEKGAAIGTSSFKLAAGAKAVFTLKDRVADAAGKRGTVEVSGGAAAVNVRFGGASLVATEALGEIQ